MINKNTVARFWSYVEVGGTDDCWEWQASRNNHGYGQLSKAKNKSPYKTHRLSWEIHNGEIPTGMSVCHKCDNPPCVNPKHLFLGTHYENMQDAKHKGRMANNGSAPGEANPAAKLTPAEVSEIRTSYTEGEMPQSYLAKKYGICDDSIAKVIRNETYYDPEYTPVDGNKRPRPHRRRFTALDIPDILAHYKKSGSSRKTAKAFSTNKTTILKIARGEYVS
jgi:hypothetical protein